jgi:cation:H+ antiporter
MSGVLMMGLIRRERHGIGQIGMESVVIMALYVFGVVLLLGGIQNAN